MDPSSQSCAIAGINPLLSKRSSSMEKFVEYARLFSALDPTQFVLFKLILTVN